MTEQEAIKSMNNIIEYWTYRPSEVEAAKLAISALEKQIPKKVTYEGFCPNCNTQYPLYPPSLNKYCGNCGQKLDWD